MNILLEYLGVFGYLKKIYNINLGSLDYKKFVYTYSLVNTFIIATIYIIVMYLVRSWVIRIVVGIILLVLFTIICYGLLARYYMLKMKK